MSDDFTLDEFISPHRSELRLIGLHELGRCPDPVGKLCSRYKTSE